MDILKMMGQAKAMQKAVGDLNEELAQLEAIGSSGGGLVKVRMVGKYELSGVHIDPSVLADKDATMIEDLIVAAHADAKAKIDQLTMERSQALLDKFGLPAGALSGGLPGF